MKQTKNIVNVKSLFIYFLFVYCLFTFFINVRDLYARELLTNIPVGNKPVGIDINELTNLIYVSNRDDNTVSVIDMQNNEVVKVVDTGVQPQGVAVASITNLIYVTHPCCNSISIINGLDNELMDTISVGAISGEIDVNISTNQIYLANKNGNSIRIIDGFTNEIIENIELENHVESVGVNPETNKIYVAHIETSFSEEPCACGNFVLVVDVIDGFNNMNINSIQASSGSGDFFYAETYGIAVNNLSNSVYVTNKFSFVENEGGQVIVIDGSSDTVVSEINITDCTNVFPCFTETEKPFGIAVNSKTNQICAILNGNISQNVKGSAIIIDGETQNILDVVEVGLSPISVAYNETTNRIYVVNKESNNVSVIDNEIPSVERLVVNPDSMRSSVKLNEALVVAMSRNGLPVSGIKIDATAEGLGAMVQPSSEITNEQGIAKFNFRFRFATKNGSIKFNTCDVNVFINQKSKTKD